MRADNGFRARPAWLVRLALMTILGLWAGAAAAQYLKTEPPFGKLKLGQRVLVDDGTCGKGKVKEVIGGDHVKAGGKNMIERKKRCIDK